MNVRHASISKLVIATTHGSGCAGRSSFFAGTRKRCSIPLDAAANSEIFCRSVTTVTARPPPGSHAEQIIQSISSGKYDRSMRAERLEGGNNEFGIDRDTSSAVDLPANPYVSRLSYPARYVTSETNPALHTFAHVGRYYSLGSDSEIKKLAPGGLPGGMQQEFDVTYANALQVRPSGVSMVAHLEHWRQTHGRRLAAAGAPVLDIDASSAYAAPDLRIPETRRAVILSSGEEAANEPAYPDPHAAPFHPARVLVGGGGVGKSGVLAYTLHYARTNGWLAINVPDCYRIMNMGKVLVKSKRRPGMVDQHDIALEILRDVSVSQSATLAKLPQRGSFAKFRYLPPTIDSVVTVEREALRQAEESETARLKARADAEGRVWDPASFVSKYEDESDHAVDRTGFTLQDMVDWGLRHPSAAVDTLLDLLGELRRVTEVPVMIIVDGANELYGPSDYHMDSEPLAASHLSIPAAIMPFTESGFDTNHFSMKRGVWLLAVSFNHNQNMDATMFGKARIAGRVRVPVLPMGRLETYAMLRHYKSCGSLTETLPDESVVSSNRFMMLNDEALPEIDSFAVEYFRMLSGGRPRELRRAMVFTPDPRDTDSLKKMERRRDARRRVGKS